MAPITGGVIACQPIGTHVLVPDMAATTYANHAHKCGDSVPTQSGPTSWFPTWPLPQHPAMAKKHRTSCRGAAINTLVLT